jgi:hypothetical protein
MKQEQDQPTVWRLERARVGYLCDKLFTEDLPYAADLMDLVRLCGKARVCLGARRKGGRKMIEPGDPVYLATRHGASSLPFIHHLCPQCYAALAHPALAIVEGNKHAGG